MNATETTLAPSRSAAVLREQLADAVELFNATEDAVDRLILGDRIRNLRRDLEVAGKNGGAKK